MPPFSRNGPHAAGTRKPRVAGLKNRKASERSPVPDASEASAAPSSENDAQAAVVESAAEVAQWPSSANGTSAAGVASGTETVGETEVADTAAADEGSDAEDPSPAEAARVAEQALDTGVIGAEESEVDDSGPSDADAAADQENRQATIPGGDASADTSGLSDQGAEKPVSPRLLAILLVATVVFAALAALFGIEWYQWRYTGPAANEALSVPGPTAEVNSEITDAVQKVFSYDFNDTAKSQQAVQSLLTGSALQEYNQLFAIVKQQAPQQKLVVTTTVKNSAVTWLQGDRARLLLFVDQRAVRTTTGETNTGPAQLSVGAEKQGDHWEITDIQLR